MKAYEIQQFGIDKLTMVGRPEPQPKGAEVKVRFHAASLNYRDLMILGGGRDGARCAKAIAAINSTSRTCPNSSSGNSLVTGSGTKPTSIRRSTNAAIFSWGR